LSTSEQEIRRLIDQVIVAETWFFRDLDTFAVMTEWAAAWFAQAAPNQSLRILSIGCCTGEEPYSIAMGLVDAGLPAERVMIDSIDVSPRVLLRAADGIYGQNSFRTDDLSFRDRHFDFEKQTYRLRQSIKELVRFSEGNILDENLGTAAKYEIIFCRNVLIYFSQASQDAGVANLRRALAPGGVFFAGPAESFLILQKGFSLRGRRRGFSIAEPSSQREDRPAKTMARRPPPPARPRAAPVQLKAPRAAKANQVEARQSADVQEAARLANSGQLAEAAKICRFYLLETGPSAQAYYLLGVILDATNDRGEAAASYKRALYLEPQHVEALSQLALLSENMGDKVSAARLRERIARTQRSRAT
jgi:chemotaxis protein methyltransferase WspC